MRVGVVPPAIVAMLLLSCGEDSGEDCVDGTQMCACIQGQCLAGLVCDGASNTCVPVGGSSAEGSGGESAEGSGDAVPVVLELVVNQPLFGEGEEALFLATVSDPDGVADVAGGALTGPNGEPVYGMFLSVGDANWQLSTTWTEMSAVTPLMTGTLEVFARFEDQNGNVGSESLALQLCGGDNYADCDEMCVDLLTDYAHCGSCDTACDWEYGYCYNGGCCDSYFGCAHVGHEPPVSTRTGVPIPGGPMSLQHAAADGPARGPALVEPFAL